MFRAALFSIVLALAFGQDVVLLCQVRCYQPAGSVARCPHHDATPSVTGNGTCSGQALAAIALVHENGRRNVPGQDAVVVTRLGFAPSPTDVRSGCEAGQRLPLDARPLVVALRL